jgi:5-formyltetrahydrofolate cyclo-ligase
MVGQGSGSGAAETAEAREKRALRITARSRRDALDAAYRHTASKQALLNLLGFMPLRSDSTVAAFWPMGAEIDTRPIFNALAALDIATCLPRVAAKGRPLAFFRYYPGEALLEGSMRVLEPLPTAEVIRPTIVVVPMLAFDDAGYRLGYGGGFYDRTLPTLGPGLTAIGLAFAAQHVPALPREATDVPLEAIVTEAGVHHFPWSSPR